MGDRSRQVRMGLAGMVGLALVGDTLRQAWVATWSPGGIPTYDIADYVLRAHHLADALGAGDAAAFLDRFFTPDVHPPLHPAVLALAFATVGSSTAAACVVAFVELIVALALLVLVGRRAAPEPHVGAAAGLVAAVLTSASVLHRSQATAPWTEPLALVATLVALALALPSTEPVDARVRMRRAFAVGGAVLAAGLVRYNLVPMLIVPLLVDHALRVGTRRRAVADWRWIGWITPSLAGFGAWRLARPALADDLAFFFTNNDSGVGVWSAENLRWLPEAFATDVAGAPALALLTGFLSAWGLVAALRRLRDPSRPTGELLLHGYVAVALAALFVHPFKLERNLYGVVPVLYLVAALPVLRALAAAPARARAGIGALALVGSAAAFVALRGATDAQVDPKRSFSQDAEVRAALDLLVTQAKGATRIVVAGAHRDLNEHLVTLTLREEAPGTALVIQPMYPPDCDADPPPAGVVCTPTEVDRWLATPGTVFATIALAGPPGKKAERGNREGTARLARDVGQRLATIPGLGSEALELHRARMRLTVYAPGLTTAPPPDEAPPAEALPLRGRRRREAIAAGALTPPRTPP